MASGVNSKFDLRKGDRIVLIIGWILVAIDIPINFISNWPDLGRSVAFSIPALVMGFIFTLLYFLKINSLVRGGIAAFLLFVGAVFLRSLNSTDTNFFMMIMLSMVLAAVYLKRKLILIHAILLNAGLLGLYLFDSRYVFPVAHNLGAVASMFMLLNACLVGLYLVVHHSRNLVNEARRNEAWTKAVFDSVNDALFIHDAKTGKVLDVNQRMLDMYGLTYEQALATSPMDFDSGHPDYTPQKAYERMRNATEKANTFEWLAKVPNGRQAWVEVTMRKARILEEDRIIVLVREVSEKKVAEDKLRESEQRLRTIINTSPDGIAIVDLTGTVLELSEKTPKMCGYDSVDEMRGRSYFEFVHSDYHEKAMYLVGEMMKGNYTGVAEYKVMRKDGSSFYADINAEILRDTEGNPTGVIFILRDISSRKAVEEQLRNSEEKFRSLIEQATEGFVLVDETGKIMEWNTAQERIWGVRKDQVLGKPFWEIQYNFTVPEKKTPEQLDSYRRTLLEAVKTGHSPIFNRSLEAVVARPDGVRRWMNQVIFPIRMENGYRIASISHDVTEQKQAAEENARLNEQLRQSEKLQAIGQLAGGVAHDYNNQLTGIMGYADIIMSSAGTLAEAQEYAKKISLAAARSADLTSKLLAFAHKGDYLRLPVDIHEIIEEVVSILSHSIDKRISIRENLEAESCVIYGDPTQLQNAILNLALNARDSMMNGGVLTFSTSLRYLDQEACRKLEPGLAPGKYISISISDTGCGMEKELMDRIFEPFFTTKSKGGGTGLGLSAVYGTAKGLHGSVYVESVPGKGSAFTLILPLLDKPAGQTVEKSGAPSGKPNVCKVILLVDDEEDIRNTTSQMLEQDGFSVVTCKDGLEALAIFKVDPRKFDLVLLDMIMPGMKGTDLFQAMKQLRPDIRALLVTGYSTTEEAQSLQKQGLDGILQKPYSHKDLKTALGKVSCFPEREIT